MSSMISAAVGFDLGLHIDWRVGVFTLAATVFASALAGIAPVRHALRLDVLDTLKSGERNPIGESLTIEGKLWEVVGLVEDAPSNSLHEEIPPFVYLSSAQMARGDLTLIVETAVEPGSLVRPLQQELNSRRRHAAMEFPSTNSSSN